MGIGVPGRATCRRRRASNALGMDRPRYCAPSLPLYRQGHVCGEGRERGMSYYYGPPPQQQPKPLSSGMLALIVTGAGVGSVILLCILFSAIGALGSRSPSSSTNAQPFTTDVPLPTRPPAPTATPVPQPL